ncbi:MAG TPA: VWA domain-containing protein [Noviherbaspirillum sp.]|uniref:nitric oxide reductase activation protein NorD n=1 Tax=Noviherbaspirillum sp. TaxID=1926288 RepID=UPI002B496B72|nr:VWA domain-containing protein [Noviherbaspirillum sp.]HJV85306.1 VWA domain-containing protein [Noviherbaspirillum sp.]
MLAEHTDITELPDAIREAIDAAATQAAKTFTPHGLVSYHAGIAALHRLGRGDDVPIAFVSAAPAIARELGEDSLDELVQEALRLASKTSGAVIERLIETAPLAASRLGDATVFHGYLALVTHIAANAPRALRPMLDKMDTLLGQLTLGGLRRWAQWGIHAHRTHFDDQVRYFGLESTESLAILQQERRGTLFVDVHRRIGMYLRALYGLDFILRPTAGDFESRSGYRPTIGEFIIHVPDAYDDAGDVCGLDIYRAAAVHAAAHIVHTTDRLSSDGLAPLQIAAIEVIEDARIEALAMQQFPRLRQLWSRQHTATPAQGATIGDYLDRVARALLDGSYADDHPIIADIRKRFTEAGNWRDNALSRDIGLALATQLSTLGITHRPANDILSAPYRDDNRHTWEFRGYDTRAALEERLRFSRQQRRNVSLMEFINEIDTETAGDDAQEVWVLQSELFPYEDFGVSYNASGNNAETAMPLPYPEWDYRIQMQRPAWTQVIESRPDAADASRIDDILTQHKPLTSRLQRLIEALQPQGVQRLRKQEDGDEIDLNAVLDAWTDIRRGQMPDNRFMLRHKRSVRDIAVMILLDLSESANETIAGSGQRIIDLALEAAVLTADTLERIGDPFAIHGFQSDGRHAVHYRRFKDFKQPYDAQAKGRLCGMRAELSTRMGAALRHATRLMQKQPQKQKLLLLLTDGAPADIDERDPQYLRQDAKKAVEEARRAGITSFCLSLDPLADDYVERIFGRSHAMVLDNIRRLPEKLPALYAALTK